MRILAIASSGFISLDILGYHPVAFSNIGELNFFLNHSKAISEF
jgi:hypothetical protein